MLRVKSKDTIFIGDSSNDVTTYKEKHIFYNYETKGIKQLRKMFEGLTGMIKGRLELYQTDTYKSNDIEVNVEDLINAEYHYRKIRRWDCALIKVELVRVTGEPPTVTLGYCERKRL